MDIECLRAVAIILTLVVHLPTLLPYPSGLLEFVRGYTELSVGVDLFFVISGFVITQSLLSSEKRGIEGRGRKMLSFWVKRAFRLLPVSFLWLAILAVYFAIIGDLLPLLKPIIAAALNVMNWYGAYCVSHPAATTICAYFPHGHYWSLSLEEQFYLIYPLLFFFVGRRYLPWLVIAAILVQLFWNRPVLSMAWFFRTDALCWGVLLGLFVNSSWYQRVAPSFWGKKILSLVTGASLVVALVLIGGAYTGFGGDSRPFGVALVAFTGAVLVWLATYDRNYFSIAGWFRQTMGYIGSRSYALYVSHLIIFTIFSQQVDIRVLEELSWSSRQIKLLALAVGVGGSFLASELSYRYLETPARNFGRKLTERWEPAGLITRPSSAKKVNAISNCLN